MSTISLTNSPNPQQLRQCFSTPPSSTTPSFPVSDWDERRNRILNTLASADNCIELHDDKDKNAQTLKVNKKRGTFLKTTIGDLSDYKLIEGEQTVKSFSSNQTWQDALMAWLRAIESIESNQMPSASFLLPYHHFGPDLVFALRHKVENKGILCSVQVSELWYAIQLSSLTFASSVTAQVDQRRRGRGGQVLVFMGL